MNKVKLGKRRILTECQKWKDKNGKGKGKENLKLSGNKQNGTFLKYKNLFSRKKSEQSDYRVTIKDFE